jgi:PAS domain S-box-containing protein
MTIFRFLQPPIFEDEEDTRVAHALYNIQISLLLMSLFVLPVILLLDQTESALGLVGGMIILLFTVWLNQRGYTQSSSLILVLLVLAVGNYLLWVGQGIHDIATPVYALVLIIAGLLLSRKLYFLILSLVIVSADVVIVAELAGWISTRTRDFTNPSDTLIVSAILLTIGLTIRLLSDSMITSLAKTRQIADQQARLILETRDQAEQLRMLNQISIAVASGLDLEQVLIELYQQLKNVVPLDSFYVALVDSEANLISFPFFISLGERVYVPRETLDAGLGLTGEVLRTQRTLHLPDCDDPATIKAHQILNVGPGDTRSYLGIPLHLHGKIIGVLSVQCIEPYTYSEEQIRLIETITSQASVAIDNAQLFVEIKDALRREERLNEVAHVISGAIDTQFILENVVRLSVMLLGADAGSLSLVSPDQEEMSDTYDFNIPYPLNGVHLPKGRGITWEIIESCRPVRLDDYSGHLKALPELVKAGFHSYIGAPILAGEQCLGALGLLSLDRLRHFTERELALLVAVGRLAGAAIQNARLFAALQDELAERRRVEQALHRHDAVLEAMTYAAEKFLSVPDWELNIPQVLDRLGKATNVTHAYLIEIDKKPEEPEFSIRFSYNAPNAPITLREAAHAKLPLHKMGMPKWLNALERGEPFIGSPASSNSHSSLPEEEEFYQMRGIRSLLSVPIFIDQTLWGALSFDDSFVVREWTEAEVDALKVAAGILSAAVQRQRADIALRESEALYRRAISAADAVPYYKDHAQNCYTFMGEGIERLSGYSADVMTPDLWDQLIEQSIPMGEGAGYSSTEAVTMARDGQMPIWKCDYLIRTCGGSARWVADTALEILGQDGKSRGSIGILQDITDRKLAEAALKESEERFRAIFENSATGIALGDMDGLILAANPSFQQLFGYSAEELHQLRFGQLSHPDDLANELEYIRRMVAGEIDHFQLEKRYLRQDGSLIWGRMTASLIHDESGAPRFGLLLLNDVTEQKRAIEGLRERDAILQSVAFGAETFMKATDWRDSINVFLEMLGKQTGTSHAYLYKTHTDQSGRMVFSMDYEWTAPGEITDLDNPFFLAVPLDKIGGKYWLEAMLHGEPYYGTITSFPPEEVEVLKFFGIKATMDVPIIIGNSFWGLIGFNDVRNERDWSEAEVDSLKAAAGILSAAIQRQLNDEAIRQLNAELEQRVRLRTAELESANRELESFAYSVSHDLRTPLRGIDGYSRLLLEDFNVVLDEQGREYLDNVRRATSQMGQLINDLLKLSRVTRLEMHYELFDLTGKANELVAELRRQNPDREVEITVQPGLLVFGDANLLRLALENLISNAWKFTSKTPQASIEIGETRQDQQPVFYVRDNGVGFDMKYSHKLFVAFQRLHSAEDFEGTGVGLATVQRIIHRHSGRIWAEAAVNQGATFFFTLPGADDEHNKSIGA